MIKIRSKNFFKPQSSSVFGKYLKYFLGASSLIFLSALTGCDEAIDKGVLNPKGLIAFEERLLLFDAIALMLIVVIPVIIMSFAFAYRYRESHKTAEYKPNWSHNTFLEAVWWGVPCVIIFILGILTIKYTHQLDPYRKIDNYDVSLRVQVIALPWKWLFVYPDHNIATVNYLVIPNNKQVEFTLTSDNVPMSAFFIPQLGSQIYTMAGMTTKLHLLATEAGTYRGLNSQFNGDGFSDMYFPVKVVEEDEMQAWLSKVKASSKELNTENYAQLRKPTIANPEEYYSGVKKDLFGSIINTYMMMSDHSKHHMHEQKIDL